MRTISFETFYRMLEDCSAVVWGEMQMVVYPSYALPDDEKDEDFKFLHLEGTDSDFNEYEVDFREKDNQTIKLHGNRVFLTDTKGNEVEIRPLFSKDLSEYQ